MSKYESGDQEPSADTLLAIMRELDVSAAELLGLPEPEEYRRGVAETTEDLARAIHEWIEEKRASQDLPPISDQHHEPTPLAE